MASPSLAGAGITDVRDWTDRVAAGELPPTPPRPQGVERNVVITEWDWADPKHICTMRSLPTTESDAQRQRSDLWSC